MNTEQPKSLEGKLACRKVALVGSASSSLGQTPWDDESFEIWGLAWRSLKRADRVFDLHPVNEDRKRVPGNYVEHLNAYQCPVYLQSKHPEVPNSVTYPLQEVKEFLQSADPNADPNYFVSSIAYMLALAMYEAVDAIYLYGIDLIDEEEYAHQRPNTEYLIGLARGLGIRVYIPEQSALTKYTHMYGYEQSVNEGIITEKILEERMSQYKQRMERALAEAHTCDGAMQECKGLITILKHYRRGQKTDASS